MTSPLLLNLIANPTPTDVTGRINQNKAGRLNNLLREAQISDIPLARDNATRVADINQQNANTAAQRTNLDIAEYELDVQDHFLKADDRSRAEGLRVAGLVNQVQTPEEWEALKSQNPIDLGQFGQVQYGTPEFEQVQTYSRILQNAAQKPDNTLVEVADETSPTGTRFVKRADAVNQPGKPPSGTSLEVSKDGTVRLNQGRDNSNSINSQGNQPLARSGLTKTLQQEVIELEDTLERVNTIKDRYSPDFLTYQGKGAAYLSSLKSKADIELTNEDRKFLKDKKKFEVLVNRDFNAYRKLITGAAAAEKELQDLKKATINTDLSPAEFEATIDIYQEELQRGLRLKRRLLRDGIQVGDERFGSEFDRLWEASADDISEDRMEELLNSGINEQAALDMLIDEGYE